ncbi:MAG: hypothetical protein KKB31_07150 [Nanoarchaeota archaeon]|nr:hypothetical protein [Nanoarchaeota archaeon]
MTESGDRIISWYLTKGYDFTSESFLEEMKSDDDINKKITTLKDFADDVSSRSKKPFSKGQKEGLRKALESEDIKGEFERDLSKREEQEQIRAEAYTAEVKRIEGLKQISEAEEFETEYPDITETIEIQNAKKVKEIVKEEIVKRLQEAREREYLERFPDIEGSIQSETRESLSTRGVRSPASLIKIHVPSPILRERGEEYNTYLRMAEEVLIREGMWETGKYIPKDRWEEV